MVYGWSIVLGTLYSTLTGLAAWVLYGVTSSRWENQTLSEAASDDWLSVVAIVWLVAAIVVFIGVWAARPRLVAPAVVVGAIIELLVLVYAVNWFADEAAGVVVALAIAVGALGFLVVRLTARAARPT